MDKLNNTLSDTHLHRVQPQRTHFVQALCFVSAIQHITGLNIVPLCVLWSGLWSRPQSFPRCLLWRWQRGRRTSCWRWCPDTMSPGTCSQRSERSAVVHGHVQDSVTQSWKVYKVMGFLSIQVKQPLQYTSGFGLVWEFVNIWVFLLMHSWLMRLEVGSL